MVLFQTWFNMGKVSPWENFLRQNPIREAFTVNIYLQTQRFYDSSVEMFNFNNFFSLTFFLFKVQLFETKSNKREFIVNTQTFICKVGRCDWHKIWCICPNWTIVFVQIEKISLSKLKKCICPNWTHVSVKVAKLRRPLFARGEIWWFIWSCSYSCSSPLKTNNHLAYFQANSSKYQKIFFLNWEICISLN